VHYFMDMHRGLLCFFSFEKRGLFTTCVSDPLEGATPDVGINLPPACGRPNLFNAREIFVAAHVPHLSLAMMEFNEEISFHREQNSKTD
jgi:hypothetical protein